ncbi:MAG: hypothetical protein QGI24_10605 [Kiritimatiellia bacterium]|jgi:hypothetical protein|nr:hypothetical protein [Kiritimatiellia bacterium]
MAAQRDKITINGKQLLLVPDGEVDKGEYASAKIRVVHVLKEATKCSGLGQALQETIRPSGTVKWRLWKVTARRSYAIQNRLPEWDELKMKTKEYGQAFKASAILNLNDTIPPGGKPRYTSKDKEVLALARLRWLNRKKRLMALSPSVVVCGGSYQLIRTLLSECDEKCEEKEKFFLWKGIPFIHAMHPSFRGKYHSEEYAEFRHRYMAAKRWIYKTL